MTNFKMKTKSKSYLNLMYFLYFNTRQITEPETSIKNILGTFFKFYPESTDIKIIHLGLFLKMIYGQDLIKSGSNPTYYNIKILC